MKAIFTHYKGPTETLPSRLIATDRDGHREVMSYDAATDERPETPHDAVAVALCLRLGWYGTLARGADCGRGRGFVYVFVEPATGPGMLGSTLEVTP